MEIKPYSQADEALLFAMLRDEGGEWECYFGENKLEKYKHALEKSLTYVAYEGDEMCGYVRCRDDDGFGVYVYDLLVKPACRGHSVGRMLIEKIRADHPQETIYVMSDVDGYYEKQGYRKIGSIFEV
jgi:ribosomal protein S18 acetylase RimI-like enzyme